MLLLIKSRCASQGLDENSFKIIPYSFDSYYSVIAIVDEETMSQPNLLFTQEQLVMNNTSAYLIVNTVPLEDIYDQLNKLISSSTNNLNKQSLKLIIKGPREVLDCYRNLDIDFFNTCYYISTDQGVVNDVKTFFTSSVMEWSGQEYLQSIQGKYFWGSDVTDKKKPTRILKIHDEGKFTIGYNPVMNFGLKNNEVGEYFTNGLNIDYAINKKLQIYAGGNFSLKRPDPGSAVRTQILNQVNFSEVLNGAGPNEQELNLSIRIEGRVYAEALVGIKYITHASKTVSPYFSSQISRSYSSIISESIDTTFVLDLSNGIDGNLMEDLNPDDLDLESLGIQAKKSSNIDIGFGTGIQCKLGGHFRFDLGLSYSTSIVNRIQTSNFNDNAVRINLGLNYRFKDVKEYDILHFY